MEKTDMPRRFTSDGQLENWFSFHPPANEDARLAHVLVRARCLNMAREFQNLLPEGPDKTVVFRKIQGVMWAANACIACNATEDYQLP